MRTLIAGLLLVPGMLFADSAVLKVGDAVPTFQLNDQHDKPLQMPHDLQAIVFTADKSAAEMINGHLKQQAADYMAQRRVVYIADISAMPGFITEMVALPKMRDYAYRIAIGAKAEQTAMLPRAEDSVTLIRTDAGKVTSIQQFKESEAGQLGSALNALQPKP
ncbi:MAG: hypothetical protein AB1717_02495 [Pseudomonadota bacterium]